MEASLLTTKLNIPPARASSVPRPRLMERLQESLGCNLVLVSAPAGFGKTTILSEWARQNQPRIRTTWISLDDRDNDPIRFWDYVIAALKKLQPGCGENTLAMLHSPEPPPIESILTVLINELAVISFEFVLVLDDYHVITSQPIHTGITFLIDHLPSQMHLIIATRADPPLPLAQFRGKGMMLEVRTADLRFTREEAGALFTAMKITGFSDDDIKALDIRTEGWAVGLKMAALAMHQQPDIPAFLASFTGSQRFIMDYLMEEVLQHQSNNVQDFLLKTSVLERFTAPLCDAVTGRSGSQDILINLERANLFIVPLDESREWYRYEHLFADLLRHRLITEFGAEKVSDLHRLASQWYEEHQFPGEAIHHALEAKDWETAMRLISAHWEEGVKRGEWRTMLGRFQLIPDEALRAHPRLYARYASTLIRVGQIEAAEAALSYVERIARDDANLQGEVAFAQADLALTRGDYPRTIEMAEKALSLLAPDNLATRARASFRLGLVQYSRGHLEEAQRALKDSYEIGRQMPGEQWLGANGAVYLGEVLWQRGRLREALEMVQQAVDLAGESPGAAAMPQSTQAFLLYERNDLEGAARSAQMAIEFNKLGVNVGILINTYFWLARARLAQGDVAGAISAMENMDRAARLPGVPRVSCAYHAAWHVMFAIRQDDLALVVEWGNRLQEYADALPFNVHHIPARLLIARGEKVAAAKQLQALYERVAQADAQGSVIMIRICQALAAAAVESALEFLADALKMAEPEGYIRSFVDEGRLLAPLLRKALSQGITPEFTSRLLSIIAEEEGRRQKAGGMAAPTNNLLSEREMEVLSLVAAGLSNQQIAEKLIISLNTAKTHVRHLFEKLNAQGRTQAIARARELKLIQD